MNGSPSVKVALFIRNGGSESPCRWFYVTGIYKLSLFSAVLLSLKADEMVLVLLPEMSMCQIILFLTSLLLSVRNFIDPFVFSSLNAKKDKVFAFLIPCLKLISIFYCRLCQNNSSAISQNKNSLYTLILFVHK